MRKSLKNIIPSFLPVLVIISLCFVVNNGIKSKKYSNFSTQPGFFSQWFEEKKNKFGVIPSGMREKWLAWDKKQLSKRNSDLFSNVVELGPNNTAGRTRGLWIHPTSPNIIIAGGMSGGVWRSENTGSTWVPINEQAESLIVSCFTHNPFNSNIIYYGTGESRANSADVSGSGVYKSIDGGKTFSSLISTKTNNFTEIWDISHSLIDSNTLYVATNNSGIWKTINAGITWTKVYNSQPITSIVNLPNGGLIAGVTYSSPIYSPNGNVGSFKASTLNIAPTASFGRISLAVCKNFSNVVYALYEGRGFNDLSAGFYKSTDSGKTFIQKSIPTSIGSGYQLYCQMIGVNPNNSNQVVVGGVQVAQTNDGGTNWITKQTGHSDQHSFAAIPNTADFLVGSDGGIYRYQWANFSAVGLNTGYNITQFYAGAFGPDNYGAVGGTQDNGTFYQLGNLKDRKVYGGDGAFCHIGLEDGTVAYISTQNEGIVRIDNFNTKTGFGNPQSISSSEFTDDGVDFINCYSMAPDLQNMLMYRTNKGIYRSIYAGDDWEKLNIINRVGIKAIAIGYGKNPPTYFGGTSSQIYIIDSSYTAKSGTERSIKTGIPANVTSSLIKGITIDPTNPYTIFIAFSNNANEPRIYKVTNCNTLNPTWTNVSGNLPVGLPVNYVDVDAAAPLKNLFAATDFGLYTSSDSGKTWIKETRIPNVAVHQVKMRKDGRLFIFTHGRGIWTADLTTKVNVNTKNISVFKVKVFPNPSTSLVNISVPQNGNVQLFSNNGNLVYQQSVLEGTTQIATNNLPKGIYYLKYTGSTFANTQKVLVQ